MTETKRTVDGCVTIELLKDLQAKINIAAQQVAATAEAVKA